jgi:lipopolysaccharide export LptBFGC system permease protein LptF
MIERDPRLEAKHASGLHGARVAHVPDEVMQPEGGPGAEAVETEAAPDEAEKRPGSRFAWLVALAVVGALIGLVIVVFMKFVNGPVSATATTTLAEVKATAAPKPTTNQLAGLYFDMVYPGIFDQVGRLQNDTHSLEQYNISSKKDYRRTMAVSVRDLEANLLDNDSSYKFRKINPKDYKEHTDKLGGEPVAVMAKLDNTEVTLFWPHQGKILTISITSSNPNDVLADFMTAVEPTLRWRK